MSTYSKKPAATPEQVEASLKQEDLKVYGTITVKDTNPIETKKGPSQVREVTLKVEVWPEGYQESLSGYIPWKLWGGQCDTLGEEIKALYHEQSGWVGISGFHRRTYEKRNGEICEAMEVKAFNFHQFSPIPDGELHRRVLELELRLGKLQEQLDFLAAKENEFSGF